MGGGVTLAVGGCNTRGWGSHHGFSGDARLAMNRPAIRGRHGASHPQSNKLSTLTAMDEVCVFWEPEHCKAEHINYRTADCSCRHAAAGRSPCRPPAAWMSGGDELERLGHRTEQTDRANLQPHGITTPHDMGELADSLVELAVLVEDDD